MGGKQEMMKEAQRLICEERKVYRNTVLHWKKRKVSNNLNLHLRQVGKKTKQNPKLIEGKKSK